MVTEDKIRLMAKADSYATTRLRDDSFARRYYRQDYIGKRALGARFWATVYFILYWALWLAKTFYIDQANLLYYDYIGLFIKIIVSYAIVLIVVSIISGIFNGIRYDRAKKRIDAYYDTLDQISDYNND